MATDNPVIVADTVPVVPVQETNLELIKLPPVPHSTLYSVTPVVDEGLHERTAESRVILDTERLVGAAGAVQGGVTARVAVPFLVVPADVPVTVKT